MSLFFPVALVNSTLHSGSEECGMTFKNSVTPVAEMVSHGEGVRFIIRVHDNQSGHAWDYTFEQPIKRSALKCLLDGEVQVTARKAADPGRFSARDEGCLQLEAFGTLYVSLAPTDPPMYSVVLVIGAPSIFQEEVLVLCSQFDPFRKN